MVLDAFLPKVFALIPLVKVELHDVLVVALSRYISYIVMDQMGGKIKWEIRTQTRFDTILSSFDVQYDSVCVPCKVSTWWVMILNVHLKRLEILLRWGDILYNIYMYGFLEKYKEQFYANWSKIGKIMDIHYALPEEQRENYILKPFWNSTFFFLEIHWAIPRREYLVIISISCITVIIWLFFWRQ